jgi:hypothetical protein
MKLTKRGEIVFAVSLVISAFTIMFGFMWLIDHINWVGDHYCFHSSLVCYGLDK